MIGGRRYKRRRNYSPSSSNNSSSSNSNSINKPPRRSNLNKAGSLFGTVAVYRSLIGCGLFVLICIGVLIYANVYHANWKHTEAEVINFDEVKDCHEEMHRNNKHTTYTTKCNYVLKYIVDGVSYDGNLRNVDKQTLTYKNNKEYINIDYNSKNPKEIDTSFKDVKMVLNWIFGILLVLTIISIYFLYKYRNNRIVKGFAGVQMATNILRPRG